MVVDRTACAPTSSETGTGERAAEQVPKSFEMPRRNKDNRRERPAHATASPDTTEPASAGVLWITLALVAVAGVVGILLKPSGTSPAAVAAASAERIPELPPKPGLESQVYDAIKSAYDELADDPSSVARWADYAMVLDAHGLHEKAIRCYKHLRSVQPETFDWAYLLAVKTTLSGAPADETLPLYDQARTLNPNYAPLYLRMGDIHLSQKRFDLARDAFLKAVQLDATLAMAHRQLGAAYVALGDASNAVAILLRAKELAPRDGLTYRALAEAYDLAGKPDDAEAARNEAKNLPPDQSLPDTIRFRVDRRNVSTTSIMRRAAMALRSGKQQKAIESFAILEAARPDDPDVQLEIAKLYESLGDLEGKIERYEKAVAMRDELLPIRKKLAMHYAGRAENEKAIQQFRRILYHSPGDRETMIRLAGALATTGNLREATDMFARADATEPLTANGLNDWGTALLNLGELDEALARYDAAIALDPTLATAHFNRGLVLERRGDLAEAIKSYERGAALEPNHPAVAHLAKLRNDAP